MFRLTRLIPMLRLLHLEQALPAVSNSWLMVFLAFALEPASRRNPSLASYGLLASLALGAIIAMGMSIYALAINDVLDLRHDRAFEPHRPLASGRVHLTTALVLALISLAAAMAAAALLGTGSILLALVAAMGILFYNTMGKHLPAVGIVALGLIWALNMFIVNPEAGFLWPIWLNMTHVMLAATVVYLLQGKRPRLRTIDLTGIMAGWLFWTLVLFTFMNFRGTTGSYETSWVWVGPGVAAAIYLTLTALAFRPALHEPRLRMVATRRYAAGALLSLMLFDAGWLAALGHWNLAAVILGLLVLTLASHRLLRLLEELTSPEPSYRVSHEG